MRNPVCDAVLCGGIHYRRCTVFDAMNELTVNELFSGIGAFRKALERLGIPHRIVGISEIDKYAIRSYEAIYGETYNYGDISKVERLEYADLWTYGFPCQDISSAGLQYGIIKGKTRSGLLYEVQRLLSVAQERNELPKFLILENVKALVGQKFNAQFLEWVQWLHEIGFNSYWHVMNAKDYGIPQNRERVFCVSIRSDIDIGYGFPQKIPLRMAMRDLLEENPADKYFLTETVLEALYKHNERADANHFGYKCRIREREREQ